MPFRPAALPTLIAIPALGVILSLGTWQTRRHFAQQERHASFQERIEAEPFNNDDLSTASELEYHRAEVTGTFDTATTFLITGRWEAGEVGYDVAQPLILAEGTQLLVNRGFTPSHSYAEALDTLASQSGSVTVSGLLLPLDGDPQTQPIPASDRAPERWGKFPYAAIVDRLDDKALPTVLLAGPQLHGLDTKPTNGSLLWGYKATPKAIGHLEYAGQWFLVAATLVFLWSWAGFRRGATREFDG